MLKKIKTAILMTTLTLNASLAIATEVIPDAGISSEEALVKAFEDTYKKFAIECVDSEAESIAPSVLIDGKLEECQQKAKEVEALYLDTKEKIGELDKVQVAWAQCKEDGKYKTIKDLIDSVNNVSSKVSCVKEEQRSCMSDLGCNVVRSFDSMIRKGGTLLSALSDKIQDKMIDSGAADKSCFDKKNGNCLEELVGAAVGNLISTGQSLWSVAKSIWGFFSSGSKMVNTTSNNLHTAVTTSVNGVKNFASNPIAWMINKVNSMITGVKTWLKSEVFCQKWEGLAHASTCEEPMDSFECLDCNDSLNAVCAAGGFAISELGIMVLTGGTGAMVSVGAKIAIKGAAVSTAKMSAMSAKAMAKVESIVPEIRMLKKKKEAQKHDAASKIKAFEMAQGAIKAFQNLDINKMKERVALFSKEKVALARAKSKTLDKVASAAIVTAKTTQKVVKVGTDTVAKVKGVSDGALEKAYNAGGKIAEKALEKATGGRLRVTHKAGSTKTVAITNGGIVVNNAFGTKVTGTSAKVVAAGRLPSSVKRNVREVKDDKFNLERFKEQTSGQAQSARKPGDNSWEHPTASNQSQTHNNQQSNNTVGGPSAYSLANESKIIGQAAREFGRQTADVASAVAGEAVKGKPSRFVKYADSRKKDYMTAAVAGAGVYKGFKSNEEVKNDTFDSYLKKLEQKKIAKIAVEKVIKTNDSVSFDRLGDSEKSIHKASKILGVDNSTDISNTTFLNQKYNEQQKIFSDENKENFAKEYSQRTGVSEDVAKDVFDTRKRELSAAKEYLQSYSKTVASTISQGARTTASTNLSQPINSFNAQEAKAKDLESKIAAMEASLDDLSKEDKKLDATKVAKEVVAKKTDEQTPSRAPASAPVRKSSSVASAAPVSSGASFGSGPSFASSNSEAAPTIASSAPAANNFAGGDRSVASTDVKAQAQEAVKEESVKAKMITATKEEAPKKSRAESLSKLLNIKGQKAKISENEELPWTLAEILKGKGDKQDKDRLAALINKKEKFKKMEEFDGGNFKLHIIELSTGDKFSVKVQGRSMEIIEMKSALELKDKILAK
ncbi:hypothetical protein M899_1298 [Bacteriovorax sp. BSW11_IV]|uniref:hypothetical protein n=1 Tax=Bacteriovorax sp. BSW11_IV TaxID=1353529 RepID=UPI00038A2A72|nr:hypothetical protein [Bacteriovorax sp. BSW11_IV]EQC45866.1 hypothetical protein M899_1298 [Bacteriovorax sp. BSW11_IV]